VDKGRILYRDGGEEGRRRKERGEGAMGGIHLIRSESRVTRGSPLSQ
jgi:hypothetical protein